MGDKISSCLGIGKYGVVIDDDDDFDAAIEHEDFFVRGTTGHGFSKSKNVGLKLAANNEV